MKNLTVYEVQAFRETLDFLNGKLHEHMDAYAKTRDRSEHEYALAYIYMMSTLRDNVAPAPIELTK